MQARGLHPWVCSRAPAVKAKNSPADKTKISPTGKNEKTLRTILPKSSGGSGATPTGALARTHRRGKNPPDDSSRIARGLGGSCRVHKPGVPHGPASQQRLGPANNAQLMGRPKHLNNKPKGQSSHQPEGLAKEEQRPLVDYFGPPLRPERSLRTPAVSGRPLRSEGWH